MALNHPQSQPEMIAHHYTKLAATALNLLRLCEMRRYCQTTDQTDEAIELLTEEIKRYHLEDLGIPLEWTK